MQKNIEQIVESYEDDEYALDVAIYVRVSTASQTTQNQLIELTEVCERNNGISAIFITKQYQELRELMKGQNSIVCCKMQVGRSLVKWLSGRLTELVVQ